MVKAKHCCWGTCPSDLRYPEKLPKSLEEMRASGKRCSYTFSKTVAGTELKSRTGRECLQ